jgi:molybdopterin-guanine dinucleotide biosynthesis protein A
MTGWAATLGGRVAAIVLAGGRSSRFGRDKLAETIDGRPMLDHAIGAVAAIATEIVVVGPSDGASVARSDVVTVNDEHPFEGPLAGLAAGLHALDPAVERVLVVGGDMPTLVPAVLDRLVAALESHEAAVLADDDGPRPLPLAVRPSAASPAVDRLIDHGERRLRALLGELDVDVVPPSTWRPLDPTGQTLRDVDVPEDLPG